MRLDFSSTVGGLILPGWGVTLLILGVAHARGAHGVFGKQVDGRLPLWSRLLYLPLLIYTGVVWHLVRLLSREPACNKVTDDLVVGRRLLPSELEGEFENYVDLTAEYSEPRAIGRKTSYLSFPILDAAAPTAEALLVAVSRLRAGRTYIHCAQGHGRTGLFALAVLLNSGAAKSLEEGLQMLRVVRQGIRLNREQRDCIEGFIQVLHF